MNRRFPLLLALALCSLLMGLLFAKSALIDPEDHQRFGRSLMQLDALDSHLEQGVLRARHGDLAHYDGIVSDIGQIEAVQQNLQRVPSFLDPEDHPRLLAAIEDYGQSTQQKRELVERFKSENAALVNSARYFPLAARELVAATEGDGDAELHVTSRILFESVLAYELNAQPRERATAIAALDYLETRHSDSWSSRAATIPKAWVHAKNILERKPRLDALMDEIFAVPTRDRAQEIARLYKAAYVDAHARSQRSLAALYLGAILLVAGVAYAFDALRRAKERLQANNEDLDRRVRDRTLELQDANEHLARDAEALSNLNQELERSNSELDDFAYIASHDLKEPLRGIHNYSAFLIEDHADALEGEGRRKLETIRMLANRMDGLIDSLLYFSRVGRTELAYAEISLQELVEDVIASVQVSLEQNGVEVRIPRELPHIYCDGARVGEIFRNLITNSLKYNDKDEKWIEIGYRAPGEVPDADDADRSVFYVRDNGIGIREKDLGSVFRIFKRLHARDKFGGGTGAGLTIVKKIVERHEGRIWVESVYGEGATFYFTLGSKPE